LATGTATARASSAAKSATPCPTGSSKSTARSTTTARPVPAGIAATDATMFGHRGPGCQKLLAFEATVLVAVKGLQQFFLESVKVVARLRVAGPGVAGPEITNSSLGRRHFGRVELAVAITIVKPQPPGLGRLAPGCRFGLAFLRACRGDKH
jgi:hypothetical protein